VRLSATVLESPDANALAAFYRALLGWQVREEEPGWVMLAPPGGGAGLSFSTDPQYVRPTWPARPGAQQMMAHLDIEVDDLDESSARAVELGATVAGFQPQQHVRVHLDPDGHPFCLFLNT
jgi:catechol 2,3-dioxygenase-like lactoylglutathione lyase family enzyme